MSRGLISDMDSKCVTNNCFHMVFLMQMRWPIAWLSDVACDVKRMGGADLHILYYRLCREAKKPWSKCVVLLFVRNENKSTWR